MAKFEEKAFMKKKFTDFMVGIFVISGIVIIVAMVIIARGQFTKQDFYYSYFNNVSGLKEGATVLYEGYMIGTVGSIEPERSGDTMRFRVVLNIQSGWLIQEDSVAMVSAISLLSSPAIQINSGIKTILAPGSEIKGTESGNILGDLSQTADKLTDIAQTSLKPMLDSLTDILNNEIKESLSGTKEISQGIKQIIENLEVASSGAAEMVNNQSQAEVRKAIGSVTIAATSAENILEQVSKTASDKNIQILNATLLQIQNTASILEKSSLEAFKGISSIRKVANDKNMSAIESIISSSELIRAELEYAASSIRAVAENTSELSETSDDSIQIILQRMENISLNLEEMSAQLRDDPSIIIRGTK